MNHKKRKFAGDDEERSLSHIFSVAAKAVSSLYANAEREHKKARLQSRQLLERQFQWILREYGDKESIPTSDMLRFLQDQAQIIENEENGVGSQMPHVAQGGPNTLAFTRIPQQSAFHAFANTPFQEDSDGMHKVP